MKASNLLVLVIFALLLIGCAKPPKDGEWPYDSKPMKGSIMHDQFYVAADGSFKILLPHPPKLSYVHNLEWKFSSIRELDLSELSSRKTIFSIGPGAYDQNIYSLSVNTFKESITIDQYMIEYINNIVPSKLVLIRGNKLINGFSKRFVHRKVSSIYMVHESKNHFLVSAISKKEQRIYAFDVVVPKMIAVGKDSKEWRPKDEMVYERKWELFNRMFNSIEISG